MPAGSTTHLDRPFVVRSLQRVFEREFGKGLFLAVTERFQAPARALVFGGVLRNAVLSAVLRKSFPVRDVDFVVFGLANDDQLYAGFRAERPQQNSFGGLKVIVQGLIVDIWRAELALEIAGQPPHVAGIEEFLKCVTLTTDAILFDPQSPTVYEQGFLRAIRHEEIDLGSHSRWSDHWTPYHLAHLAYLRELTGFRISAPARMRVRETATESAVEQAIQYLESRNKCRSPRDAVLALIHETRS